MAAAADLSSLEKPLAQSFRQAAGESARFVFGSSGMLARQIENGAPYDVFLSANERYVKELAGHGELDGPVRIYATGRLGLWSATGSIRSLEDLAAPKVLHVAIPNPAYAPYGVAARQALENQGLWKRVEPKIVYGENVRQTLEYAESGNAEAAVTAWSLVLGRGGTLLPREWHGPIRQAGGILKRSRQIPLARRFMELLESRDGRELLRNHGLFPPAAE